MSNEQPRPDPTIGTEDGRLARGDPAGGVVFRAAKASDNAALLALSKTCPMEADISFAIEREPDFFALSRARGEGHSIVGELDGELICCASVCRRPAYLRGQATEMGYVGDIKVAPAHRRAGLAQRLLNELAAAEVTREPAPYVGLTAVGNDAVDGMLLQFGKGRVLQHLARFTSHQLIPARRFSSPRGLQLDAACAADAPALISLLDNYHRPLNFAPVFGDGGLEALLARSPGMTLESYRVARRDGRLVAALACWPEESIKRTRVIRLSRGLRWASRAIRLAGRIGPAPAFPAEGDPLRFSYLRHPAHAPGEADALRALIRTAVNEAGARRDHFALFTAAQTDPVSRCLRGIPRSTYHYQLLVGCNTPDHEKELATLADALPYDDAALA